jgi:hypothetical protein
MAAALQLPQCVQVVGLLKNRRQTKLLLLLNSFLLHIGQANRSCMEAKCLI